ncbi:MAG: hypothetical protein U9Q07_02780 [Planctomycetota bacterium]|nr:hypothetical protein [Planctomycetota bacterium]
MSIMIDFCDAYCAWRVPVYAGGPRPPDELHVVPKTDVLRTQLRAALGSGELVTRAKSSDHKTRYRLLREEEGAFVMVTERKGLL